MLFTTFAQKGAQNPFGQSGGPLSKKVPDIPTLPPMRTKGLTNILTIRACFNDLLKHLNTKFKIFDEKSNMSMIIS